MDPQVVQLLIAAFGICGSVVGGVVGAYVAVKAQVAVLQQRVDTVEEEVRGLRESKHHVADAIQRLQMEIWKIRPYDPKDHER